MRYLAILTACFWICVVTSCATLNGDACKEFYPFTASSNSPITAGETIELSASYLPSAQYHWTGPNGFTSDEQSVWIYFASLHDSGSYKVTATANDCENIPPAFAGVHMTYPDIPCNPSPENKVTFTNGAQPMQFGQIYYSMKDGYSQFTGNTLGGDFYLCLQGDSLPQYDNVYDIESGYCGDYIDGGHANINVTMFYSYYAISGDVYVKVYPDKITMTFCDISFGSFSGSGTLVYYK
jgi:hypothetical protein